MTPLSALQETVYDILVVYNSSIAKSAQDAGYTGRSPFDTHSEYRDYSRSYAYFLASCKAMNLRAAFTTTQDIDGVGTFTSVWEYNTTWKRCHTHARAHIILNKFSTTSGENKKAYKLLTSHPDKITLFHDQYTRSIFDDKLNTFHTFPESAIPTVAITAPTLKGIRTAQDKLNRMLQGKVNALDFSGIRVLKDRFGAGGVHIFQITSDAEALVHLKKEPEIEFVLQPSIEALGFRFKQHTRNIDLRVIIMNGKIIQSYIRIAKKNEFRANAKQGGSIEYIELAAIPKDVIHMIRTINQKLPIKHSFYALDFIKSKSGHLYFIEGNSTPGLNWFDTEDELHAKSLIRILAQELKLLSQHK